VTAGDDSAAVLGRYTAGAPPGEESVSVELLNFPLQLFAAARERHDELMREFALLALAPDLEADRRALPARLAQLVELLGRRYAAAGVRIDSSRDAAVARGELAMDLTYQVPRSAGAEMASLHDLIVEADAYCRDEQLLTLAPDAEQKSFRDWFLQEFVRQLAGEPPRRWDGPMTASG